MTAQPEGDSTQTLESMGLEEADNVALLRLVVVAVDLRTKLHLFDDRVRLIPPRLARLLGSLVLELAVVHELADGRAGHRCDLDQIQIGLAGQTQGVLNADDADLLSGRANEPHFRDVDAVVDTRFVADGSSWGGM